MPPRTRSKRKTPASADAEVKTTKKQQKTAGKCTTDLHPLTHSLAAKKAAVEPSDDGARVVIEACKS